MPLKHSTRFMVGFRPIIEANKSYLLGGRMVDDGPVFKRFGEALSYFNAVIALNVEAGRAGPLSGMRIDC